MPRVGLAIATALAVEFMLLPPTLAGGWGSDAWGWALIMFMFLGAPSAGVYAASFIVADKVAGERAAPLRIALSLVIPALAALALMMAAGTLGQFRYALHAHPYLRAAGMPRALQALLFRLGPLRFPFAPVVAGALAGALARELAPAPSPARSPA
jgi:hypothetical protein